MTRCRSHLGIAALAALAFSQLLNAQADTRRTPNGPLASVDPALFKGLRYRMVGPNREWTVRRPPRFDLRVE